jgi:hypothetical protein
MDDANTVSSSSTADAPPTPPRVPVDSSSAADAGRLSLAARRLTPSTLPSASRPSQPTVGRVSRLTPRASAPTTPPRVPVDSSYRRFRPPRSRRSRSPTASPAPRPSPPPLFGCSAATAAGAWRAAALRRCRAGHHCQGHVHQGGGAHRGWNGGQGTSDRWR